MVNFERQNHLANRREVANLFKKEFSENEAFFTAVCKQSKRYITY